VVAISRSRAAGFLHSRLFTFLGDVSYSFYLLHLPLLITISSLFANRVALSPLFIFVSMAVLALLISYLSFIYIEKPFQVLAKRLTERYKLLRTIVINGKLLRRKKINAA
jgi:peptidoglycan/LPS O-acetylase OafA/YrhL